MVHVAAEAAEAASPAGEEQAGLAEEAVVLDWH